MRKFLATLLFPVYIFAFSISLNSGAESGKPYSVLQLRDDVDFECVEQILAYDKKRYVCMIDDGILPPISDTILPLADIKYKKQDGKLFIVVLPKANSRILAIKHELYDSQNVFSQGATIGKHFSIIIDPNLSEFDKQKRGGLNFAPDFSDLMRPPVGALDLNKAPIETMDSNDIDLYMDIKKAYDAGAFQNALDRSKTALERHPQSLFASEFLLYRLRALDKIFENQDEIEGITPSELIEEAKAWMKKFPTESSAPEVGYIIVKSYLKNGIASDAKYTIDMLKSEHEGSKFTELAQLAYAGYIYKSGRPKDAVALYEDVLYGTKDIDVASRAALALADANIDKQKYNEAKNFVLKILNANENFLAKDAARAMNLAAVFSERDMPDVAARIYEIIVNNSDKRSDFYEAALKNAGINLAKTKEISKAHEYLQRYQNEYKYGDYAAEVSTALDKLFFELKESNTTKLRAHYQSLMEKYANSEIGQKALISELELDVKERKFKEALSYTSAVKEQNLTRGVALLNEAAYELALQGFRDDDCELVVNLIEHYDVNRAQLPQFKLFNCYFRTARYQDALALAKARAKEENLEDRVEWLVNLSKILYRQKDYANAVAVANDALSLGANVEYSDPTPALYDRFYSLLKLRRFEEAIATLSAIEQLRGQDFKIIECYEAICDYGFANSDFATVSTYAKKALQLQTRAKIDVFTPKLNFMLATALLKIDDAPAALDEAKFILNLRLKPEDRLRALGLAGEIYVRLKQPKEAQKYLQECVGLNFVSPYKAACEAQLKMLK